MITLLRCRLFLFFLVLLCIEVSGQAGHDVAPPPPAGLKSLSCTGRPVPQLEDITEKTGITFRHSYSPEKKYIPESAGTLKTDTVTFGLMTFAVILVLNALSYFPALALGPIAEYFSMLK